MLYQVTPLLFDHPSLAASLQSAERSRLMSVLCAPVGLIAIVAVFTLEMPAIAKAVLLVCGGLCDISAYFAWKVANGRIKGLRVRLGTAKGLTAHLIEMPLTNVSNDKLADVSVWAAKNRIDVRYCLFSKERGFLFAFDNDDDAVLFKMKFT